MAHALLFHRVQSYEADGSDGRGIHSPDAAARRCAIEPSAGLTHSVASWDGWMDRT